MKIKPLANQVLDAVHHGRVPVLMIDTRICLRPAFAVALASAIAETDNRRVEFDCLIGSGTSDNPWLFWKRRYQVRRVARALQRSSEMASAKLTATLRRPNAIDALTIGLAQGDDGIDATEMAWASIIKIVPV